MTTHTETSAPLPRRALAEVPLLVVAAILLSTGADIFPRDALISAGALELNLPRLLILAGLAVLLVTEPERGVLFRSRLELPLLLLLLASLAATLKWNTDPRFRFLVESVAFFYLTLAVVRSRPDARFAIAALALVAVGMSALPGIAEVSQDEATGFYRDGCEPVTVPPPLVPSGTVTRATGTFDNPNLLAGHILLLAPLAAAAVLLSAQALRVRLALGLVVALAYVGLLLTFSRTAVFAALIGLGVAFAISNLPRKRYLAGVGVALAVASLFLFATCGSEGAAGFGRTEEWKETVSVIGDNPAYGVGLGRIGDVLRAREEAATAQHSHNLWLTWWADAGPAALLAWVWIFGALLWWSLRGALRGTPLAGGALLALLCFAGFSMLDHPANADRVATAFWAVAALAAGIAVHDGERPLARLRRRRAAREPEATSA